jgi:hypothetical protein
MKVFTLMSEHPELTTLTNVLAKKMGRDDLAQTGLYDTQDSGRIERAATTLSNLDADTRSQFLQAISAWAKENGEKDPQGVVSSLAEAFKQAGDAMGRGVSSAWGGGLRAAYGDQQNEKLIKELQRGKEVRLEDGIADLSHAVTQRIFEQETNADISLIDPFGLNTMTARVGPIATPKEREQLLAQALKQRDYYQAYRELDAVAKEKIKPIRPVLASTDLGKAAEMSVYGTAEFAPVMGASMAAGAINPVAGFAVMADAMRSQEYNRLRLQYPGMSAENADTISAVSSLVMAGVGELRIGAMKGGGSLLAKVPFLNKAITELGAPTSSFWRPFIGRAIAGTAEQTADMAAMSAAPAAVQHMMHALGEDVPDVDWQKAFGDAVKNPETWFAALPFALVGAGIGTWRESRAVAQALPNPEALQMQGIPEDRAHEIATEAVAGRMDGAESLFREAWANRTKEDIARGEELRQQAIERSKAVQQSPETPSIRQNGDQYEIVEPNGKVSATFDNEQAAMRQYQDRLTWEQGGHAQSVRDLVQWFRDRVDPNRSVEITGKTKTVAEGMDESPLNAQALAERMRIAGIQEGADPSTLIIKGETTQELREGIYQDVVKIHNGADVMDVVEEHAHAQLNKDMRDGVITREQSAEATKAWARETGFRLEDPENPTDAEIHEAAADMVKSHFLNERKQLPSLPSSIRAFIARMRVYLQEVLGRAKILSEMRDAGKLSKDWQGYLARSLGIDDQVTHNRAVEEAVGKIEPKRDPKATTVYSIGKINDRSDVWKVPDVAVVQIDPSNLGGAGRADWRREVRKWILDNLQGKTITNDHSGLRIKFTSESRGEAVSKTRKEPAFRALKSVDSIVKEALYIDSGNASDPASEAYHYFVVPVEIDGKIHAAWFNVREPKAKDPNSDGVFYEFGVDLKNETALTRSVPSHRFSPEDIASTSKPVVSVPQFLESVKGGMADHIPPKPVGKSFSIGRADYLTELSKSLDGMKRSPEERLQFAEKAKENLTRASRFSDELDRWTLLEREQDERSAQLELDVENLHNERDRQIEELHQRKADEIAKAGEANTIKFGDRIEAAKTDRERKLLEREARESATEIKRGIEKDFRHQETALKEKFRVDERAIKEKALGVEKAAKAETEAADRRGAMLQALADLDAVLMALPPEVRGKIGGFTKLATLKTDNARVKFFQDRLEKVSRALDAHLKEQYGEQFEKLFEKAQPKKGPSRVQKSTLGPEAQAAVATIERFARMGEDSLASEIAGLEAKMDGETDPARLAALTQEWAWAQQFGSLDSKTASELASAVEEFKELLQQGRSKWKFQEEARLADVKAKRDQVLSELKRPHGVTDSELAAAKKRDRKTTKKVADFIESNLDFAQTLQEAFQNGRSKIALHFEDRARLASNAYTDAINHWKGRFRKDMMALFGAKNVRELNVRLASLAETKNTGVEVLEGRRTEKQRIPVDVARRAVDGTAPLDFTRKERDALKQALYENDFKPENRKRDYIDLERVINPGEKTIQEMSQLEAVHYLLSWAQEDVRARMERQGWTSDAIQGLRNWLSPEANKVMGWLRDRYAEGYDRINPVYRRMYGMNMPRIENYAPTFYDTSSADQGQQNGPLDTTASRSGMAAGFIKSRANHNAPLARVDALSAFWRHTVQSEYWATWAETVREMRGVLGSSDVLRTIRAVDGAAREEAIKKWVKAFETNGQTEAGMLKTVSDAMRSALSANAALALGFKVGTLMKQAGAMLGSAMELSPGAAAAGWGRFLTGQLETSLSEVWKSDTIQRRIESGYSPEVRTVLQAQGITPSRFAELIEKGMYPVGAADAAFTTISAAIAYDHHYREAIKAGMPEVHAKAYAMDAMDRVVHRTAQPAEAANKSLNEVNAGVFGKLMMLFKSEARQKFAISYLAAKRMLRGEEIGGNASRLFVTWMLASAVTQTMGNIYQTIFTDKDSEEVWKWEDYARAMALGHLDGAYIAGPAISTALTWALGGHAFSSKSQNPFDQIAADIQRKQINPANWRGGDDAFKGMTIYLQILARTGISESLTGAAALANAIKDAIGLTNSAKKKSGEK